MARPSKLPPLPVQKTPSQPSEVSFELALSSVEAKRLRAAARNSGTTAEKFIKEWLRDVINGRNDGLRWVMVGLLPEHIERWEEIAEGTDRSLGETLDVELGYRLEELDR